MKHYILMMAATRTHAQDSLQLMNQQNEQTMRELNQQLCEQTLRRAVEHSDAKAAQPTAEDVAFRGFLSAPAMQ